MQRENAMAMKRTTAMNLSAAILMLGGGLAFAAGQYGPGASDTEIKIGNTAPYSGPGSGYGTIGKSEAAYFAMINEEGGVNGRKIDFISRDDSYSPPKTVEAVRQLVEEDHVLAMFNTVGTPTNSAIVGYMNENKVPQLFVGSGAAKWDDPKRQPWTIGWQPSYQIEARIYAHYILKHLPNAKIAVLYQNDDFGKDYFIGLRQGLGAQADKMIVATQTYETTDPTVDSQVVALQGTGADVLVTAAISKFASQAIRKIYDIGWRPTHFLTNVSTSVGTVMRPAGPDKAIGIISTAYLKDPTDPQWQDTPEYKTWLAWMKKYNTQGNVADTFTVYGYTIAQTMAAVLKACGNDLTRENLMKQATGIRDLKLPMLLPGITISTGATDYAPIKQMQLMKFDGTTWRLFGEVISGDNS
jgi:branched-chain amino acid transport system substrate-binding protein